MRVLFCIMIAAPVLLSASGCTTMALETTDVVSEKAAEEESPTQEANEGPVEHAVEEAGKATQKGVETIEAAKEAAVEKAKEAIE